MPPILIVGEAYGELEEKLGVGFVGPSGGALFRMLHSAKIITLNPGDEHCISRFYETHEPKHLDRVWKAHALEIVRTNVFNLHPPGNDLDSLCGPKAGGLPGYPPLVGSHCLRAEYEPELDRLADEILRLNPNLILCLGTLLYGLWAAALASKSGEEPRSSRLILLQVISVSALITLLLCYADGIYVP